jgi:hypothetical protein
MGAQVDGGEFFGDQLSEQHSELLHFESRTRHAKAVELLIVLQVVRCDCVEEFIPCHNACMVAGGGVVVVRLLQPRTSVRPGAPPAGAEANLHVQPDVLAPSRADPAFGDERVPDEAGPHDRIRHGPPAAAGLRSGDKAQTRICVVLAGRTPASKCPLFRSGAEPGVSHRGDLAYALNETRNYGETDRELLLRPEASRLRQRRAPVLPDRQICAIPTSGGG